MTNKKYESQERYAQKNKKKYTFAFMKSTEADLIEKLESVENKAGYIKSLIRADIKKSKKKDN